MELSTSLISLTVSVDVKHYVLLLALLLSFQLVVVDFSQACKELGEKFDNSFPACTFSSSFLKWRSACAHQFHFSGQDKSTVAQRAETIVAKCSLKSCV